jgi:hypothetical protein
MPDDRGSKQLNPYESPATTNKRTSQIHRASCIAVLISAGVGALGLLLFVTSFVYHIVAVGIPPQDPAPEEIIRNNFHFHVARVMAFAGMGIGLLGVFAFCCTGLWSLSTRNHRH